MSYFGGLYFGGGYFGGAYLDSDKGPIGPPPPRIFTGVLVDRNNVPIANAVNLRWRFWDNPDLAETAAGFLSTNGVGQFTLDLAVSTLGAGAIGYLEIDSSDGTVTQSPPSKAFYGPVQVA